MANEITKEELIGHLNRNYPEGALLVVDIWSAQDVASFVDDYMTDNQEVVIQDVMQSTSEGIWREIAEKFEGAFDYTTSILNDTLFDLVNPILRAKEND